jgi:predicted transcriptional regulator YdeE
MNKTTTILDDIKLVGFSVRTSNAKEMNPQSAQIGIIMQKFFSSDRRGKIFGRKSPNIAFAVYTNYESDEHGDYTYFLGEEVREFKEIPQGFEALTIPTQNYVKFTSSPGKMPDVCINMWQSIWKMSAADLGGKRSYSADFEIYDDRSQNPNAAVLDIYIGIGK